MGSLPKFNKERDILSQPATIATYHFELLVIACESAVPVNPLASVFRADSPRYCAAP